MRSIGWVGIAEDGDPKPSWRSGSSWNRGYYGPIKVYRTEKRALKYSGQNRVKEVFVDV